MKGEVKMSMTPEISTWIDDWVIAGAAPTISSAT